jgi:hypothetical protein
MGNFYTNVTTRGPSQSDVAALLRSLNRNAFLTPTTNGFTVICDRECENQDTDLLGSLALTLSTHLECPALSVLNHDDDVLWYQLFCSGKLLDAYISASEWWEDPSEPAPQGNPENLCRFMGAPGDPARVKKILVRSTGVLGYLFAIRRHQELLEALGQPPFAAGLGFTYLSKGDLTTGLGSEQLLLV